MSVERKLCGALGAVLLAALAGACGSAAEPEEPGVPPNLLFISIDTLRADALGAYGGTWDATPFLDRFTDAGLRFDSAWTHTPKTAPAHMSMFTGLPPRVHGVGNQRSSGNQSLSAGITTLAEALQAAGYRTGAVTSGGNVKGYLGFERGFEVYDDAAKNLELKLRDASQWIARTEAETAGARPWFFFFHTYAVHDPYLPPTKFRDRFASADYAGEIIGDSQALQRAVKTDDRAPWASSHQKAAENFWQRVDPDSPEDMRYLHELYMASVASLDFQLRRFMNELDKAGRLENTLIVLTSDHGEEFGEHGSDRHNQLWSELLHVPLVVHLPGEPLVPPDTGFAGPRAIGGTVRHMDLVPSLVELLGVEGEVAFQQAFLGESWAAWLADPELADDRPALAEHRSRLEEPLDIWALRHAGELVILPAPDDYVRFVDRRENPAELSPDGAWPGIPAEGLPQAAALLDLWKRELGRFQTAAGLFGAGEGIELDPETRAELEGLGYL